MGGDDRHGVPDFNPLLIGLMGIIAGSMMVATYHCISLGCCFYRRAQAPQQRNMRQSMQNSQQERPATASSTSSTTIGLIPLVKYSKKRNEETCSVCLCEFKEGEQVRVLPECLHLFHVPCIDLWLSSHSNCPLCRADTMPPPHVELPLPDSDGHSTPEFQRVPDFVV